MFPDADPPRAITFAPNIDAETYANPPPPLIDPPPSTLFPASSSDPDLTASPRRASHSRKKPDDWIPRPPNAFILFRSEMVEQFIKSQHVPGDVEANHGNLSKIIGLCWRNLPFPERSVWEHKARLAQAAHKAQYPHYRFRPHAKGGGNNASTPCARRRVKEPPAPPDARRVAHIAGLLVDGVKGAKLAHAVKKMDEERTPSVVEMRFDEPVTAEQFAGGGGGGADKVKGGAKKRRVKVQVDVRVPQPEPEPIMFEPVPVAAYPEEHLAWSPPPAAAWSPTADESGTYDTGGTTWSAPPPDDTAAWSDAQAWPQHPCTPPPTTTTPPYYDPHTPNYDPHTPTYDPHTPTYDPQSPTYDPQWPSYAAYSPFPPDLDAALSSPADTPQRSPALAPAYAYSGPPVDVYAAGGGFDGEMTAAAAAYVGGGGVGDEYAYGYARGVPVQCFEY